MTKCSEEYYRTNETCNRTTLYENDKLYEHNRTCDVEAEAPETAFFYGSGSSKYEMNGSGSGSGSSKKILEAEVEAEAIKITSLV